MVLNRPRQFNAYTPQMCDELAKALANCCADDDARLLVVTANGRSFCSGVGHG